MSGRGSSPTLRTVLNDQRYRLRRPAAGRAVPDLGRWAGWLGVAVVAAGFDCEVRG